MNFLAMIAGAEEGNDDGGGDSRAPSSIPSTHTKRRTRRSRWRQPHLPAELAMMGKLVGVLARVSVWGKMQRERNSRGEREHAEVN